MKNILSGLFILLVTFIASNVALAEESTISRYITDKDIAWGPCPEFFPAGCRLAAIHGDPSKPNADVYFKVPGKTSFPAHWHTSAERMVLVSGEMDVTYVGQDTTYLKTGMYAYGPAKAVHEGRCVSEADCILFIAFEAPVDAFAAK